MHPRSLPVRESPLPGESLTSFVRRHVVGMGYESMVRLLSLVDEVELPPPSPSTSWAAVRRLAICRHCSVARLSCWRS